MGEAGFNIKLTNEQQFCAFAGRSLLASMLEQGLAWLDVGCRSGGCGVCRVRVLDGVYDSMRMSRSRISEADEVSGIVLACRIFPRSDMRIERLPLGVFR